MIRLTAIAAFCATAAAAVFVLAGSASATTPQLVGIVGQNNAFKISLTSNGKTVSTLKAGTYTFVIHDDSKIHNYVLSGPNGRFATFTQAPFVGTKTFTLTLGRGAWKAFCVVHASTMFQRFTVT
jgi:hypothetical protein